MANLDFDAAYDVVLDTFNQAWHQHAASIVGYVPEVEWQQVAEDAPKSAGTGRKLAWARVVVRHVRGEQRSLGEPRNRRFIRTGIVSVQVFTPKGKRGLTLGHRLGKVAVDAFEGRCVDGLEFRRTTLREGGASDAHWQQVNVTADFDYDVVK